MILYRSASLDVLAVQLTRLLLSDSHPDPLAHQTVIVPNHDMSRWLKLRLTKAMGLAANIRFLLPAEWQWEQIGRHYKKLPERLASQQEPLFWSFFEMLSDPAHLEYFELLGSYIKGKGMQGREMRTAQLARKLAILFDEYVTYRSGMVLGWESGHKAVEQEKWQADLWRLLLHQWSKKMETEFLSKASLNQGLMATRPVSHGDPHIHVFHPGLTPQPVMDLLKWYANVYPCSVYLIDYGQACDDSKSVRGGSILSAHPLIESMGGENRRVVASWLDLLPVEKNLPATGGVECSTRKTLLCRIQDELLGVMESTDGAESDDHQTLPASSLDDPSVQIRSCHSPLREVETLYEFLLEQFEANRELKPDDVLVVTPDPELYASAVEAVFSSKEPNLPSIPYSLSAGVNSSGRNALSSFSLLMALMESRFEVDRVLDLFISEPVKDAFKLVDADVRKLSRWIEENQVQWGLDDQQRAEFGQPAENLQTWQTALRRIWMGQLMGCEEYRISRETLLHDAVQTRSEKRIWAAFDTFLLELKYLCRQCRTDRTVAEWCRIWEESLFRLFEESTATYLASSIKGLTLDVQASLLDRSVSFTLFRQQADHQFAAKKASAALFGRGVVFASMVPARNLPFEIVALIGINEGQYPRRDNRPDFDLIRIHPSSTDRNRKDEDRNLFLASVLSARKIHYVSYVGQSAVDNDRIPPSIIVSEWARYLAGKKGAKPDNIIKKEALTSFSSTRFRKKNAGFSVLRKNVASLLAYDHRRQGMHLREPHPELYPDHKVDLLDVVGFVRHPVRYYFRKRFDLHLQPVAEQKSEFGLLPLERYRIFDQIFGMMLEGKSPEKIIRLFELSGLFPSGWAGRLVLENMLQQSERAIGELTEKGIEPKVSRKFVSGIIGDFLLEGEIELCTEDQPVALSASRASGKMMMSHWIYALAYFCSDPAAEKYQLLADLNIKKPDSSITWYVFERPPEPEKMMNAVLELKQDSSRQPLYGFPNTSYQYLLGIKKSELEKKKKSASGHGDRGTDRNKSLSKDLIPHTAIRAAREAFEGGYTHSGERNDSYNKNLLGADIPFDFGIFDAPYHRLVGEMLKYHQIIK